MFPATKVQYKNRKFGENYKVASDRYKEVTGETLESQGITKDLYETMKSYYKEAVNRNAQKEYNEGG